MNLFADQRNHVLRLQNIKTERLNQTEIYYMLVVHYYLLGLLLTVYGCMLG